MGIKGSSTTGLKLYRSFYLQYKVIRQTVSDESGKQLPSASAKIRLTVSDESIGAVLKRQDVTAISAGLIDRFFLGWSHYVVLLTIDNPDERRFYEIEAELGEGRS